MSVKPSVISVKTLISFGANLFVNDPTKGYGIFIENMLAEAEKIK